LFGLEFEEALLTSQLNFFYGMFRIARTHDTLHVML